MREHCILYEAREAADPVHLVRLFGIRPHVAVNYVHAAHPDKALPRLASTDRAETRSSAGAGPCDRFGEYGGHLIGVGEMG